MRSLFRLPEPCQPASLPVPFTVFAIVCFILVSLPNGGGANSFDKSGGHSDAVATLRHAAIRQAEIIKAEQAAQSAGLRPAKPDQQQVKQPDQLQGWPQERLEDRLEDRPQDRPMSIGKNAKHFRILKRQAHLPTFVSGDSESSFVSPDGADPRLQRNGESWELSESFGLQVGADPFALVGVGFPNIETHGENINSHYKPYKAVVDWKLVNAKAGEWKPIPAVFCGGLSSQQIADRAAKHERAILSYAMQYGVSASLVKAVITKESCFDTQAVSHVGAEGLMQLMPDTARWLKVSDRADVNQNLSAGIRYLSDLRKRFGSEELALAAYNAGPGNVERYGGIPPFEETQDYVKSVMAIYKQYTATTRFVNQRVSN